MGYIKKLKNNELVGGTDKTTIYPVTSTEAVFEEVSDGEFKSQKYLNNNITNERIVDNTIENDKLKDDTVDMGKLNTQLKTIIQNAYDASWKVKKEPFSLETKYDANDVVYDPDTNSSYVSLTADNQGNPVRLEDEEEVNPYWRLVINGISAVQATEEIEATKDELIDYIQENLKDQVDDEIADAESRVAAAEEYTQGVLAEAEQTARSISGIVYQTVAATPNYTDTIPVQNKAVTAQIGYYTCSGGSGATIIVDDTDAVAFTPVKGGQVKILMTQKSTVTSGNVQLQFGSVTATKKVLVYNEDPVSSSNTWEVGEVISVYYDGTKYHASSAQGGSNKKIDAYLYSDLKTLAVGGNYSRGEVVKTTDKQLRSMYRDVNPITLTDVVGFGALGTSDGSTYRANKSVGLYSGNDADYADGDYAIGTFAKYELTVTAGTEEGNITINNTPIAISEGETADDIASDIAENVSIDGWTLTANDNVVTVTCNTIGNNTTTINISDTDNTGVTIAQTSVAGINTARKYNGESWADAELGTYITDAWIAVDINWLTNNVTRQHSIAEVEKNNGNYLASIECFNYEKASYGSSNTSSNCSKIPNGFIIHKSSSGSSYPYIVVSGLEVGKTYTISFDYRLIGTYSGKPTLNMTQWYNVWSNSVFSEYVYNVGSYFKKTFVPKTSYYHIWLTANNFYPNQDLVSITNLSVAKIDIPIADNVKALEETSERYLDAFDIEKQTIGATYSSILSVEKTDTGYKFMGTQQVSQKYAYGTIGPMIVGREYTLIFNAEASANGIIFSLDTSNPLSANHVVVTWWTFGIANTVVKYKFTAPTTTMYIRCASNDVKAQRVEISNIKLYYTCSIENILDDLGYNKDEFIVPNNATSSYYDGKELPKLNERHHIGWVKHMNQAGPGPIQGGDTYGDYLVEVNNSSSSHFTIYNLRTKTTAGRADISLPGHCNTMNFSPNFYDENDMFPLLYVSDGNNALGEDNKVRVVRITYSEDVYTAELLQTITLPSVINGHSYDWSVVHIDKDYKYLWWTGYHNNKEVYLAKFSIPAIFDNEDNVIPTVTLTDSDVLDEIVTFGNILYPQSGSIINGILYLPAGVPSYGSTVYLHVYDIWRKEFINSINLTKLGFNIEPECAAYYDGSIYVTTQANGIYKFYF